MPGLIFVSVFSFLICGSFFFLLVLLAELSEIEPNVFLRPFLEVIRSEDTTGPITGLALTSVNKFLSYALIGKHLGFGGICSTPSPAAQALNQLVCPAVPFLVET